MQILPLMCVSSGYVSGSLSVCGKALSLNSLSGDAIIIITFLPETGCFAYKLRNLG